MVMKTPLPDPRLKRSMTVLGWAVFGLALLHVYILPNWMDPEAFKLVDGKIEALLVGLAFSYVVVYKAREVPFLVFQLLAVREFYEDPVMSGIAAIVSLSIALSPPGWLGDFSDFQIKKGDGGNNSDDEFGDIGGF